MGSGRGSGKYPEGLKKVKTPQQYVTFQILKRNGLWPIYINILDNY